MINQKNYVVPSLYLQQVRKICADKYIDLPRLLAQVGLSTHLIRDPNLPTDQVAFTQLLNEAAKISADDLFGFLTGKEFHIENIGTMGQVIAAQTCVANIYPIINYLFNVENRGARHDLIIKGSIASHEVHYLMEHRANCDQMAQLTLTAYFNVFSQVVGDLWQPTRILYKQPKPANTRLLEQYYGCPVVFGATKNAIEFPSSLIYQHNNKQIDKSRQMKIQLAQVLTSCDDLGRLVACYIEFNLATGNFDKASIAKCLGVHPRVLQNCLTDKGLNFKDILEDVRKEKTYKLLKNTQLSVAQIAAEMGYHVPSTFVRAFKQWTNTTPLQWRKSNQS